MAGGEACSLARVDAERDDRNSQEFRDGNDTQKDPAGRVGFFTYAKPGAKAVLSNNVTLKQSRLSGEPRIEWIGSPYGETRSRGLLEQMGFQSEVVAHTLRIFLPQGEAGNKALTRYMRGKDVVDVTSREGADVMGDIRFSLGIATGRDLTEEQSADLTIERLSRTKNQCSQPPIGHLSAISRMFVCDRHQRKSAFAPNYP